MSMSRATRPYVLGREDTDGILRSRRGELAATDVEMRRKDNCKPLSDEAAEIIERARRNLQRACALLDCLRVAAMYGDQEEIEPGMWLTSRGV